MCSLVITITTHDIFQYLKANQLALYHWQQVIVNVDLTSRKLKQISAAEKKVFTIFLCYYYILYIRIISMSINQSITHNTHERKNVAIMYLTEKAPSQQFSGVAISYTKPIIKF